MMDILKFIGTQESLHLTMRNNIQSLIQIMHNDFSLSGYLAKDITEIEHIRKEIYKIAFKAISELVEENK